MREFHISVVCVYLVRFLCTSSCQTDKECPLVSIMYFDICRSLSRHSQWDSQHLLISFVKFHFNFVYGKFYSLLNEVVCSIFQLLVIESHQLNLIFTLSTAWQGISCEMQWLKSSQTSQVLQMPRRPPPPFSYWPQNGSSTLTVCQLSTNPW